MFLLVVVVGLVVVALVVWMLPDCNGFGWAITINKDDGYEARLEVSLVELLSLLLLWLWWGRRFAANDNGINGN
jgi:hypothetical protein